MTGDDARIRYLVESPYGLAAVTINELSALAQYLACDVIGDGGRMLNVLMKKHQEAVALRDEIAGARARARGMGDG